MDESQSTPPLTPRKSARKVIFAILGFTLSIFCLWWVLRDKEFHSLLDSWQRIEVWPLVGSVLLYWGALVIVRSHLIRHLLHANRPVPVGRIYRYICIGFLSNNILPARMGEVLRAAGIARVSGLPIMSVAGSVTLERLLDFAMLALIGLATLAVAPMSVGIRLTVFLLGGGLAVAFSILAFLARKGLKPVERTDKRATFVPLWNLVVRFTEGLKSLSTSNGITKAVGLSFAVWMIATVVLFLRLLSFGLPPSIPMTLVLITSLSLGVALPSAPAYVGVYHAFAAGALTLLGVDETIAVGFAIFCHLTDIIPGCILGAVSMFLEGVSFADLKRPRVESSRS